MIVAIPTDNKTDNKKVSSHFGRSQLFTLFQLEDDAVKNRSELDISGYQPCHLPGFFQMKGIDCVIAGGMGERSRGMFRGKNIQLVLGVKGAVDDVIQQFIDGTLESGDGECDGQEGQGCHQETPHRHGLQAQHGQKKHGCDCGHGHHGCGAGNRKK